MLNEKEISRLFKSVKEYKTEELVDILTALADYIAESEEKRDKAIKQLEEFNKDEEIVKLKKQLEQKEERIKNNRGIVQKQIIFPDKSIVRPNTDIGRMMDNMTKYSFDKPNLHDDSVDSICMYASEIILGRGGLSKPKPIKRPF